MRFSQPGTLHPRDQLTGRLPGAGDGAGHVGDRRAGLLLEAGRMLLGGLTEPADVAVTVGHVALDAITMTGTVIYTDAGFTAR